MPEIVNACIRVCSPRFGLAEEALQTVDAWGIDRAVLVPGPVAADFGALYEARKVMLQHQLSTAWNKRGFEHGSSEPRITESNSLQVHRAEQGDQDGT